MVTSHESPPPNIEETLLARRHDIVVDNRRVAYTHTGAGERVCVLIHGMGGCAAHWALTVPALAPNRRVFALDLPGFGDSEMPTEPGVEPVVRIVEAIRAMTGVDRLDLIGHSMGTLLACEVAARRPEIVRRMVLASGPITSVVSLFHSPIATLRRDPALANFLVEAATAGIPLPRRLQDAIVDVAWVRRLAMSPYVPHPDHLPDSTVRHFLSGAGGPGTFSTLRQGLGYDFTPALAGVKCPILLIGGQQDKIAPEADLRAFAAATTSVQNVEIIAETGHLPMLEQPEIFNKSVEKFLNATDRPT
ncbi:alpha/beta fold hydrolase [Nocardia noduli]|uniref:alpha/beta fold hydrolase n=1 Tax=Nocardia noduli TaxID=2815722 RepID=UPI001C24BF6C|nr:alpha/beta hydrolase [Nocardia noduli]